MLKVWFVGQSILSWGKQFANHSSLLVEINVSELWVCGFPILLSFACNNLWCFTQEKLKKLTIKIRLLSGNKVESVRANVFTFDPHPIQVYFFGFSGKTTQTLMAPTQYFTMTEKRFLIIRFVYSSFVISTSLRASSKYELKRIDTFITTCLTYQ